MGVALFNFFEHTYLESKSWIGFTFGLNTRISRNLLVAFDATGVPRIKRRTRPRSSFRVGITSDFLQPLS